MSKVLIWLASGERDRLEPGILWGINALKYGWVDDVRFVVFGESEKLFLSDHALFEMINDIASPMFCKYVAESEGIDQPLLAKGANLVDVGRPIAQAIKEGFQVITF